MFQYSTKCLDLILWKGGGPPVLQQEESPLLIGLMQTTEISEKA